MPIAAPQGVFLTAAAAARVLPQSAAGGVEGESGGACLQIHRVIFR
jgi:hypothetical protein